MVLVFVQHLNIMKQIYMFLQFDITFLFYTHYLHYILALL